MKKMLLAAAIAVGAFALATAAQATIVSYNLDFEFSGATDPAGSAPWMTLTFDDGGSTGSVDLTISSVGLVDREIADAVYFNFTDAFLVTNLNFTPDGANTATGSISLGSNGFGADGGGYYDILLEYPQSNSPSQAAALFGAGETLLYTITSTEAITASSFEFLAAPHGDHGVYHAAAHVQRIGANDGSGWIGDTGDPPSQVPEPASMLLFGTGLVGLAGVSRRKKK